MGEIKSLAATLPGSSQLVEAPEQANARHLSSHHSTALFGQRFGAVLLVSDLGGSFGQ